MRTDSLAPFLAVLLLLTAPQAAAAALSRNNTAPAIPSEVELERAHAVIGRIIIRNENIFDLANPKDDFWLGRLADRLHPVTRIRTVSEQLLFHAGQPYSRHLLDESARILRANPYFYDASVTPVAYRDGKVDILVVTRDVWTLNPGFNFSRSGGTNQTGVTLEDVNTLGTGTDVKLQHTTSVDRSESDIQVMNPHTLRHLGHYGRGLWQLERRQDPPADHRQTVLRAGDATRRRHRHQRHHRGRFALRSRAGDRQVLRPHALLPGLLRFLARAR